MPNMVSDRYLFHIPSICAGMFFLRSRRYFDPMHIIKQRIRLTIWEFDLLSLETVLRHSLLSLSLRRKVHKGKLLIVRCSVCEARCMGVAFTRIPCLPQNCMHKQNLISRTFPSTTNRFCWHTEQTDSLFFFKLVVIKQYPNASFPTTTTTTTLQWTFL